MSDLEQLLAFSLDQMDDTQKLSFSKQQLSDKVTENDLLEVNELLDMVALAEQPIEPSNDVRDALFASLSPTSKFEGYLERFKNLFDLPTNTATHLLNELANRPNTLFEKSALPNTELHYFDGGALTGNSTCGIVKIGRNKVFPAHQHQGEEFMLVLQGQAIDSDGIKYLPGDIIASHQNTSHSFKTGEHEDFIFAVKLEKSNKWLFTKSILDKIFHRWVFKKAK